MSGGRCESEEGVLGGVWEGRDNQYFFPIRNIEQLSQLTLSLGKKGSRPMKMSSLNFLKGTVQRDGSGRK